jgi:biotin carboxyl carrier protein
MKRYRIQLAGKTYEVEILSDPCQENVTVRIDGKTLSVNVWSLDNGDEPSKSLPVSRPDTAKLTAGADIPALAVVANHSPSSENTVRSPLPGTITEIAVRPGQTVNTGEVLLVIEAMKMSNKIRANRDGSIGRVMVDVGEQVSHGAPLLFWAE